MLYLHAFPRPLVRFPSRFLVFGLAAGVLLASPALRADGFDNEPDGMDDAWEASFGLDLCADDAFADPDGDGRVNFAEFMLGTDPLIADTDGDGLDDGADAAPLSRAAIPWGDTRFTNSLEVACARPAWLHAAFRQGGHPTASPFPAWAVEADDTNTAQLVTLFAAGRVAPGLRLTLFASGAAGAGLVLDLLDTNLTAIAQDVADNLLPAAGSDSLDVGVPLQAAGGTPIAALALRRTQGALAVSRAIFYTDADGDGLDADEEALAGSSDLAADSDGDGLSDFDEVRRFRLSPDAPDSDHDGYPDGWDAAFGGNPLAVAAKPRLPRRLAAGTLTIECSAS